MSQYEFHPEKIERGPKNLVGVGLRSAHYRDALVEASSLDFLEVHTENFFAKGGVVPSYLSEVSARYPMSFHGTALGLGSASGISASYLDRMEQLVKSRKPLLVSDHACFCWGAVNGEPTHAGDLLPVPMTKHSLTTMARNVDEVQNRIGRQILVENIVSYVSPKEDFLKENQFLLELTELTACGVLIDLNNLLVNAMNYDAKDPLGEAKRWLLSIPSRVVGEIHLAGFAPQPNNQLIVDDHSRPVSAMCWELYDFAIALFGPVPTLIEWDNDLPSWQTLVNEAYKARAVMDNYELRYGGHHAA